MSEKEEKHETDIEGKIVYKQNRVVSGNRPHRLLELVMCKYRKKLKDEEEESTDIFAIDTNTWKGLEE